MNEPPASGCRRHASRSALAKTRLRRRSRSATGDPRTGEFGDAELICNSATCLSTCPRPDAAAGTSDLFIRNYPFGRFEPWANDFRFSGMTRGSTEAAQEESGSLRARPFAGGSAALTALIPPEPGRGRKTSRGCGGRRLGSSCLPSGLGFRRPSFHELEHRAPLLIVTNHADPALVQAKLGNGKNLTVRAPKLHFFEDDPFSRPTKVRTACLRRFASDSFNQNHSFASVALWSWLKYHVVDKPRRADIGGHAQRRGAVQRT